VPVPIRDREGRETGDVLARDEGIRPDTSLEVLATLPPVFREGGRITAGNSSQVTDGAAALLLMSRAQAAARGIQPLATVRATAVVGVDPVTMLLGPAPATRKVLAAAGLSLEEIDHFEVNEAFASVVLAFERELHPDMERVNPLGGAIALGHPLGASGARLATTLVHSLVRSGRRYGLQTMCAGGGLATATIFERS
jgi:acetyl-CoA acyltransferase